MQKQRATIMDVKRQVENCIGRTVVLEAHKSKKKMFQKVGVIEEVYPSIFTIYVKDDEEKPAQRFSFSYSDVLTRTVKLALIREKN